MRSSPGVARRGQPVRGARVYMYVHVYYNALAGSREVARIEGGVRELLRGGDLRPRGSLTNSIYSPGGGCAHAHHWGGGIYVTQGCRQMTGLGIVVSADVGGMKQQQQQQPVAFWPFQSVTVVAGFGERYIVAGLKMIHGGYWTLRRGKSLG